MINNTKSGIGSGIGSGVLNKRGSIPKKQIDNRESIEDFQNAEKEIADKMMQSEILMKKNPSIGNLSEQEEDQQQHVIEESPQHQETEGDEEEDYEMKFPS